MVSVVNMCTLNLQELQLTSKESLSDNMDAVRKKFEVKMCMYVHACVFVFCVVSVFFHSQGIVSLRKGHNFVCCIPLTLLLNVMV